MNTYRLTLQPREYFEETKTINEAIMEAEGMGNDLKRMLACGAEIASSDGTNIIIEAQTQDPKTMGELKALRFEIVND